MVAEKLIRLDRSHQQNTASFTAAGIGSIPAGKPAQRTHDWHECLESRECGSRIGVRIWRHPLWFGIFRALCRGWPVLAASHTGAQARADAARGETPLSSAARASP